MNQLELYVERVTDYREAGEVICKERKYCTSYRTFKRLLQILEDLMEREKVDIEGAEIFFSEEDFFVSIPPEDGQNGYTIHIEVK